MRILLSYSSAHFDPRARGERCERRGSSANVISGTLYDLLNRHGEVTFVDAFEPAGVAGERFDLFVGIAPNFRAILESCEIGRSVFVAVNMHPEEHNRLLLDFMVRERLPSEALHELDILDASGISAAIDLADHILCFGNIATYNSFIQNGVPKRKIRVVNYASGAAPPAADERPEATGETQLLYVASEIGLRKGFDILAGAVTRAGLDRLNAHLHVAGAPSYPYYREQMAMLEKRLGERMTNHGWLRPEGDEYRALMSKADILFFPSIEEGQAGTVLDAMHHGVIPLISAHCGVDFAPLGFCDLEVKSAHNVALLERACALTDAERQRLREKTLEYYDEFHAGFEPKLADAVADLVRGESYPRFSVVLPVHNKENMLPRLLRVLDRTLRNYGNVDLCVILDGCTDASEEVVRHFFAQHDAYPVEILTTPDIFEVKSNNIGLRRAAGRYGVVVQDDNFLYDQDSLFEAAIFLEKSSRAVIVGGLAGVNFYPRGTRGLDGPGQIAIDDNEVYWRQDADTNPELRDRIFQVDACMRGPLIFRKSFLEEHGYLDEEYAPLYSDDMDICFRAADRGQKVYCILMDVENDSLTMGYYDTDKARWLNEVMRRNTDRFYRRWKPSTEKDYLWLHRTRILIVPSTRESMQRAGQRARRRYLNARKRWLNGTTLLRAASALRQRLGLPGLGG